jgi:hypothetical protein
VQVPHRARAQSAQWSSVVTALLVLPDCACRVGIDLSVTRRKRSPLQSIIVRHLHTHTLSSIPTHPPTYSPAHPTPALTHVCSSRLATPAQRWLHRLRFSHPTPPHSPPQPPTPTIFGKHFEGTLKYLNLWPVAAANRLHV